MKELAEVPGRVPAYRAGVGEIPGRPFVEEVPDWLPGYRPLSKAGRGDYVFVLVKTLDASPLGLYRDFVVERLRFAVRLGQAGVLGLADGCPVGRSRAPWPWPADSALRAVSPSEVCDVALSVCFSTGRAIRDVLRDACVPPALVEPWVLPGASPAMGLRSAGVAR